MSNDRQERGGNAWAVIVCCWLLTMLDGFDTQAIGFVAPAILHTWRLPPSTLGPIFSAGLFGALIGSVLLGHAGDRYGRIRVLGASVFLFASGMIATMWAKGTGELLLMRLVTGIGLGGALPNLLAIAAMQFSSKWQATGISFICAAIPMGASLGGAISVSLMSRFGWPSVFLMGGALPIPCMLLLFWVVAPAKSPTIAPNDPVVLDAPAKRGTGFAAVLAPRYRAGTIMLWSVMFLGTTLTYTLTSWLPTLLTVRGFPIRESVLATVLLNIGAVVGGISLGRLGDMWGIHAVVAMAYLAGCVAIAMIGVETSQSLVLLAITIAAVFALGGHNGLGIISTVSYEDGLKATGIGLAVGVGRAGAVLGPLIIGHLLAGGSSIAHLFLLGGITALLISILVAAKAKFSPSFTPT